MENEEMARRVRKAKALVKKGWGQEKFYRTATDCYCMVGALCEAFVEGESLAKTNDPEGGFRPTRQIPYKVQDLLPSFGTSGQAFNPVYDWNDFHGRTKSEVVAKLEEIATQLEQVTK